MKQRNRWFVPDALPGTLPNGLPGERHAREAFEILKRVKAFANK